MPQLTRRVWLAGVTGLTILGVGLLWWRPSAPQDALQIGGPFSLTGGDGKTVTDRDLRGRWALIYFGYTFCPDVCPTTLNAVTGALDALGADGDKLQPVFISIDPARDTPAVIRDYTHAFSPRLLGLTGSPEAIASVAKAYRVYYARHVTGPRPGDYTMDHSSILYLMNPEGRFQAVIRADAPAADIARDVKRNMES